MKELVIAGFTSDLTPDDKPTISIFGPEGSGKTRFAATAPGPIGLLPLDKKSKRTFETISKELGVQVLSPKEDFISAKDAIKLAQTEDAAWVKQYYTDIYNNILAKGVALAEHPQIKTIVIDTATQLWDWLLFAHFGRKNQIETFMRGAVNQDMIDLINALKSKNLILIHRASEEWKDTGEVDKQGKKKQAPSGKFKAEGFSKVGYYSTVTLELINKKKATTPDEKFQCKIITCQTNSLLEGQDMAEYSLVGEEITFDNLMTVIGME